MKTMLLSLVMVVEVEKVVMVVMVVVVVVVVVMMLVLEASTVPWLASGEEQAVWLLVPVLVGPLR